ncbi:MAG TPA: RNA methyltransferase [Nannocystaceae bacterium]|nr:RNA methyltransferase [Nannocystaceae bacterium]
MLRELPRGAGARTDRVIVEGELAVMRALASRHRVELVVASPSAAARIEVPHDADTLVLSEAEIGGIVGFEFHRGCVAVLARPQSDAHALARLPARTRVVALDRVVDPANVGAIVRTARALAIDLVVLGGGCGDPWSRRAMRASMGAVLDQPLVEVDDLAATIDAARDLIWWAADAHDASPLGAIAAPDRLAIVLGNEGQGLTPSVRAGCDAAVRVPIADGVDSLNVAAAAAVLLFTLR